MRFGYAGDAADVRHHERLHGLWDCGIEFDGGIAACVSWLGVLDQLESGDELVVWDLSSLGANYDECIGRRELLSIIGVRLTVLQGNESHEARRKLID